MYTGTAGSAFFLWRIALSDFYPEKEKKEALEVSCEVIEACTNGLTDNSYSVAFYTGPSGLQALRAVIYYSLGKEEEVLLSIKALFKASEAFNESGFEFEILYGVAGYLQSLLFALKHLPKRFFDQKQLMTIVHQCFDLLCDNRMNSINFAFHHTRYFGAAHGMAGILLVMMHFPALVALPRYEAKIQNSLDLLMCQEKPPGAFICSMGNPEHVYQWCHGNPGIVATLLQAHKIYGQQKYLDTAKRATNEIWKMGLILKGFDLCHGILGNAYSFLQMYQHTQERKYLEMAYSFCCAQTDSRILTAISTSNDTTQPEEPLGLMEGLAGHGCFNLDIQQPDSASFPAYYNDMVVL